MNSHSKELQTQNISHTQRDKSEPGLVYLDFKEYGAKGILDLIKFNYSITAKDIHILLNVDAQWGKKHIRPHVKHIFLNRGIKNCLINLQQHYTISEHLLPKYWRSQYFFYSKEDFVKWLINNTKATRQTICIDIFDFLKTDNPVAKNEFINCFNKYKKIKTAETYSQISKYLNEEGKTIIDNAIFENIYRNRYPRVDVSSMIPWDKIISSEKKLLIRPRLYHRGSRELAYRSAFDNGLIKISIDNSISLFLTSSLSEIEEESNLSKKCPVVVPYCIIEDILSADLIKKYL